MGETIGFLGLGVMGAPMALNLRRAGVDLVVWNRSRGPVETLVAHGAQAANAPAEVFARSDLVLMMLAHGSAIDEVLQRGSAGFAAMVAGKTLVHMGTTSPEYSQQLEHDVSGAGGTYLEAPVSGSRGPAEAGELVAMLAGAADVIERIEPLLASMCRRWFVCGAVPRALQMKLAVNLFLVTQVTGLVEAVHLAERLDLDLQQFRAVIEAGPLVSPVAAMKLPKLVGRDFTVQASITDVFKNTRLILETAQRAGAETPLIRICRDVFAEADGLGLGTSDMAAVLQAFDQRAPRS